MTGEPGCIWIQGAGELASGVAWRLTRCGYRVVTAELPRPRVVRRLVSYAEAVHTGWTEVEGIPGELFPAQETVFSYDLVGVLVDPTGSQLRRLAPVAVVDARMTKRPPADLPVASIPVIGLGPGFRCGRDARLIVETHRGARLGAVIERGSALADTGHPGPVDGITDERLLRSPAAGRLRPVRQIGDLVTVGETIGHVGEQPVTARIDGLLRGLVHGGTELSMGEKVGDIDPRGAAVDPHLISDKALAVAGGVLEALLRLGIRPELKIDRKGNGTLS